VLPHAPRQPAVWLTYDVRQKKLNDDPTSLSDESPPWGWALAFLWMPGLVLALFAAAGGPNDQLIWLTVPATPIVCAVAAWKIVDRDDLPHRKIWFRLNVLVCVLSSLATLLLFIGSFILSNAWKHQ